MNVLYFKILLAIGLRVYDYIKAKRATMTPEQIAEWDKQWVDDFKTGE